MINFNVNRLRMLLVLILLFVSVEFFIYYNLRRIFYNFSICTLNKNVNMQENLMNVLTASVKDISFLYFDAIINSNGLIAIFKNKKLSEDERREKIYRLLYSFYTRLSYRLGRCELHFHTFDGRSFLRFYAPDKYGDDLKRVREDVVYVMNYKKPVSGFITGAVLTGYRCTFPIISEKGEYLGSVDISKPIEHFIEIFKQMDSSSKYKIVLKKERTVDKLYDKYRKFYKESDFGEEWVEIKYTDIDEWPYLKGKIDLSLPISQAFAFKDYIVIKLPLKNFKNEVEGYLIVLKKSEEITQIYKNLSVNFLIFTILIITIFVLAYFYILNVEKLNIERNRFKAALVNVDAGIFILDSDLRIVIVNKKATEILGYSEKELLGHHDHEIFIKDYLRCPLCEGVKKGSKFEGEMTFRRKNGELIFVNVFTSSVIKNEKVIDTIVTFYDITTRKILENRLYLSSITDSLTEIYNRRFIDEELASSKERADKYGDLFSVIILDIDNFKQINDQYGHLIGDEVLKFIARYLRESVRITDIVGRWGGDELVIITKNAGLRESVIIAESLIKNLKTLEIGEMSIKIQVSIGVSVYKFKEDIQDLIKRVDNALYKAKSKGKNRVEYEI